MSAWENVALGEIIELKYGKALKKEDRSGGQVAVVGSSGIVGWNDSAIVNVPTLVVGRKGSIGSLTLVEGRSWPIDTAYYARFDPSRVHLRWLWRRLAGFDFKSMNKAAAIPGLNRDDVYRLRTVLPPIVDQQRIASIFDEADAVRTKRRAQLAHLDELPQSLFREMSSTHYSMKSLAEVAIFFGGGSLPESVPFEGQAGGTLLTKVSDMNLDGNETLIHRTALWTEGLTARSATVERGAVILPKRGAAIATNKKRITTRKSALDPNMMGVMPNSESLLTEYLFAWFCSFDLSTITSGSSVPQLNKKDLAPLTLPVPPLADQRVFTEKVAAIRTERDRVAQALDTDNELFVALQHRAFRGEL